MDFYLWFVPSSKKYPIVLLHLTYFTNQIYSSIKLIMFFLKYIESSAIVLYKSYIPGQNEPLNICTIL